MAGSKFGKRLGSMKKRWDTSKNQADSMFGGAKVDEGEYYARLTKAQVAYPQILSGYDAVSQWIETNGKQHGGSPREVYFADFDAAGPNDEVCDVAFPLA